MPWQEYTRVTARKEFVTRATQDGTNMSALCRQYGISRKTGDKWVQRGAEDASAGDDRPRTPHHQPRRWSAAVEAAVLAMRDRYPTWGGRKLEVKLREAGLPVVPRPSTITAILQRHGRIAPRQRHPPATRRFTHAAPHDLWQMDFMGHRPLVTPGRVHPLTILDDHSRVLLSLTACPNERLELVWEQVTACFARYGLPRAILTDNGPPWGPSAARGITRFEAWLLRLGIELWHGRPAHPQTQGKVERIHRTINVDVFGTRTFRDVIAAQHAFDAFRAIYNLERPHEELAYAVPMSRLHPSPRPLPPVLPLPVYAADDTLRRVRHQGAVAFANRSWFISRGLIGEVVAIRPTAHDGVSTVHFCHKHVGTIDLRRNRTV